MNDRSDLGNVGEPPPDRRGADHSDQRRAVLRGVSIAMPTILTLHSGAALARTSNLLRTSTQTTPGAERQMCVDKNSVDDLGNGLYDLGEPPQATVTAIPTQTQYFKQANGSQPASKEEMCANGGTYYYQSQGWNQVNVAPGGYASALAMASFAGALTINNLPPL